MSGRAVQSKRGRKVAKRAKRAAAARRRATDLGSLGGQPLLLAEHCPSPAGGYDVTLEPGTPPDLEADYLATKHFTDLREAYDEVVSLADQFEDAAGVQIDILITLTGRPRRLGTSG